MVGEQQWITVQQKTFTKWLVPRWSLRRYAGVVADEAFADDNCRLNTKIKARDVAVADLVTDLSDGVCSLKAAL
jgi:hypothetical protein